LVYIYNPALKPGLTRKFRRPWRRLYQITRKISELNYEIVDQNDKKQLVHVNRFKRLYNQDLWKPNPKGIIRKRAPKRSQKHADLCEENEFRTGSLPMRITDDLDGQANHEVSPDQTLNTPDPTQQITDTPKSERIDPSYCSPETPRSRRELQTTRLDPPIKRSRACNWKREFTPIHELKQIESRLQTLESKVSDFHQILPRSDSRRGMINFGGIVQKSLFGTAVDSMFIYFTVYLMTYDSRARIWHIPYLAN
jgi:hypothetical protein